MVWNRFLACCLLGLALCARSEAAPVTYKCSYSTQSNREGTKRLDAPFELTFVVDPDKSAAYVVGNAGSNPVEARRGSDGGMTFLETTASGTVQVTAIDKAGRSAHSRHTIMSDGIFPSQSYGTCSAKM